MRIVPHLRWCTSKVSGGNNDDLNAFYASLAADKGATEITTQDVSAELRKAIGTIASLDETLPGLEDAKKRIDRALVEIESLGIATVEHFPSRQDSNRNRHMYLVNQMHPSPGTGLSKFNERQFGGIYETCQVAYCLHQQGVSDVFEEGRRFMQKGKSCIPYQWQLTIDGSSFPLFSEEAQSFLFKHENGKNTFKRITEAIDREWQGSMHGCPYTLHDFVAGDMPFGIESEEHFVDPNYASQKRESEALWRKWGVSEGGERKIHYKPSEGLFLTSGDGTRSPISSTLSDAYEEWLRELMRSKKIVSEGIIKREKLVVEKISRISETKIPILFFGAAHGKNLRSALQDRCTVHTVTPKTLQHLLETDTSKQIFVVPEKYLKIIEDIAQSFRIQLPSREEALRRLSNPE